MPYKDPERRKEYYRKYYVMHPEWRKAYASNWRLKHPAEAKASIKEYRKRNPDKVRMWSKNERVRLKVRIMTHYSHGKPRCACCGEECIEFLTIDHINNDGKEHRQQIGARGGMTLYYWLEKNGYPSGFQILCFNCNIGKATYGICPHDFVAKDSWHASGCPNKLTEREHGS